MSAKFFGEPAIIVKSFARIPLTWSLILYMVLFAIIIPMTARSEIIQLSAPSEKGSVSLEEAIAGRRTIRSFSDRPVSERQISQLFWAAGGITEPSTGKRSAPSAGALYPLEIYMAVGESTLPPFRKGIYRYLPHGHALEVTPTEKEPITAVARAALRQMWMADAPVIFLIAAEYERTTIKYGERGFQYVHQEAGCASENLLLQTQALGLKSAVVGAFFDQEIAEVYFLPSSHRPLLLIPVGH